MPDPINSRPSPFYANPSLYHLLMRFLYRENFNARYQLIAREIPERVSVVDVCAGDAYLYFNFLKEKDIRYTALDNSSYFIRWGQKKGIEYSKIKVWFKELDNKKNLILCFILFAGIVSAIIKSHSKKNEPIFYQSNIISCTINNHTVIAILSLGVFNFYQVIY